MQTIEVERNTGQLPKPRSYAPDAGELISDALVVDRGTGLPVVVTGKLPLIPETKALRKELTVMKWSDADQSPASGSRLGGFANANTTFGYADAKPLRRRYGCSRARVSDTHPAADALLDWHSEYLAGMFKELLPNEHARQLEMMEDVGDCWKLPGGTWTSGIVNETAALPYHRDAGNIASAWSVMIVLRRFVSGGHLHIPEYDVTLDCSDGMFMFFDGGSALHGVTPMAQRTVPGSGHKAYRRSIVWYARRGMRACLPTMDEEIARARVRRSVSEVEQAEKL
tara:strand:+ start:1728 stop:2576 length:849 start_codon:yes stop_codon:yes gene_type:complete